MAAERRKGSQMRVLDQLLEGRDPATVFASGGLVDELRKSPQRLYFKDRSDGHGQAGAFDSARSVVGLADVGRDLPCHLYCARTTR